MKFMALRCVTGAMAESQCEAVNFSMITTAMWSVIVHQGRRDNTEAKARFTDAGILTMGFFRCAWEYHGSMPHEITRRAAIVFNWAYSRTALPEPQKYQVCPLPMTF